MLTKMGRIIVNKHFDEKSSITPESFVHNGEIIISNQAGSEGIFIKNTNGKIFYIVNTIYLWYRADFAVVADKDLNMLENPRKH